MRLEYSETESPPDSVKAHTSIEVEGRMIAIDKDGYLLDFDDWSPAVTEALAEADGVQLSDEHWLLIDFLHRFYKEYEIAPEIPILARNLCKDQNDCRWNKRYIESLFPGGAKMACRFAGLTKPVGRSCL
ncbi:MAG: TusE/DsrC/DsvC family sulfur relay protein [Candidatus Thiodiazotropha sp.]|nr:TusE/DsrC/DsvC family sulfur relay protein [Candidatus Thiodiazotropha sp.]MCU7802245.1 TusE/DsrC/DsvC family sulfur relay protein [Candidatus Thiodiazotropha sp. (ex Lucinoma borealis)]MCU7883864.1 TusE/DsrC/DsvC family sulfur relay protein [Candidatus Thiodiazotropha sp. (ex Lucinoma annulata)]MCU7947949.1 TusE/DsrC/DsvC family sulfur relay protein [Candidatus Thiodiazotropha sp. (ex Cardiolucina cf. quadrata)]MCM8882122.1 TusE/DsrC/DsvC family sulfur relay protein [Candidatus Thiodiazotro